MNITLHIDRLVLDGLPVQFLDGALLQVAVEKELRWLFAENGIPRDLQGGGNQAHMLAPTLRLDASPDAKVLGAQIGSGVYSVFAGMNQKEQGNG
jgi:hypothetical protein